MCDKEKRSLLDLIDLELRNMDLPQEFSNLSKFITDDNKAAAFIRYMLEDDSYIIPGNETKMYEIAKSRARHSAITYLMGLVFRPFGRIYENIPAIINNENCNMADWLWIVTALNHDKGYYSDYLKKETLDYKRIFKRFLLTDTYKEAELKCLDQFSTRFPQTLAYSYDEILAYDQYATDYHMRKFESKPESKKKKDDERKDHGILGGIRLFHDLTRKAIAKKAEEFEYRAIKACCLTIAQHNIFKSSKSACDKNYDGYEVDGRKIDLSKLHSDNSFKITQATPLLLFLCLIDTIECIKKFSRGENPDKFLDTLTTLKSIYVSVSTDYIELDLSRLTAEVAKKEGLQDELDGYKKALRGFNTWTIFSAENQNDIFKLSIAKEGKSKLTDVA